MWVGLALMALPITAGLCFIAYLLFCSFIVRKTGSTAGLKDVAIAMRAYRVPLLGRTGKWPSRN